MQPFLTHKGTVVALMNDNIDTDQIIPKQYLKRIERTGFGEFFYLMNGVIWMIEAIIQNFR
ncbi:hypothetical protein GCM10020331_069170 [Ectobacillus funiculus]